MNKDILRMQMLAGIITESQYRIKLNEKDKNYLLITLYNDRNGFIKLDNNIYYAEYGGYSTEYLIIKSFDQYGDTSDLPPEQKNKILLYLDSLKIPYEDWNEKNIYIEDPLSYNIKLIKGSKPEFLPKPLKSKSKFKILDFFIKKDNPKWVDDWHSSKWLKDGEVYDFGGGEDPIDNPKAIVIDLFLDPEQKKNPSKFIEADLSKYIELPPKNVINISSAVAQINSPDNLSKTIKHALKPGGILVIKDHISAVQSLLKYLKDFKLLEINYFDVEDPDDMSLSDQVFVVLQK